MKPQVQPGESGWKEMHGMALSGNCECEVPVNCQMHWVIHMVLSLMQMHYTAVGVLP